MLVLAATGAVIWWPGIKSWRRSLTVTFKRRQRFTWRLHSALGFWFFAFVVMWGVSGLYLSYPQPFSDAVERLEAYHGTYRTGERILYWLGYSHFGRFGNRIPGCGPSCDKTLKIVWAVFGLMPLGDARDGRADVVEPGSSVHRARARTARISARAARSRPARLEGRAASLKRGGPQVFELRMEFDDDDGWRW